MIFECKFMVLEVIVMFQNKYSGGILYCQSNNSYRDASKESANLCHPLHVNSFSSELGC